MSITNKKRINFALAIGLICLAFLFGGFGFYAFSALQPFANWSDSPAAPARGNGTQASPYIITAPNQLGWLYSNGSGAYVELGNDLNMSGYQWQSLSNTRVASLDGKGYIISGLTGSALFSVAPTVKNLTLAGVSTTNGAVANETSSSSLISKVIVSGTVTSTSSAGGIVGVAKGGTIEFCESNASVSATVNAGGIAGNNTSSTTIKSCQVGGEVKVTSSSTRTAAAGGIIGSVGSSATINLCYSSATINGYNYLGGIAGIDSSNYATVTNSGFNGKIISNSTRPLAISTIAPKASSSFGIASVENTASNSTSIVRQFGGDNISDSYSFATIKTKNFAVKTVKKYKSGSTLSGFVQNEHFNNGYPFPKGLFTLGQFIENSALTFLNSNGFNSTEEIPFGLFNDSGGLVMSWSNMVSSSYVSVSSDGVLSQGTSSSRTSMSGTLKISDEVVSMTTPTSATSGAFYNCDSLKGVEFPETISNVGDYAFYDCSALTSVKTGNNLSAVGTYAFAYCENLTSMQLGSAITTIGDYAFYYCAFSSVTLSGKVTKIGAYSFMGCSLLNSVSIPVNVTEVGSFAFAYCFKLSSVTFASGAKVSSIGDFAFWSCISLKHLPLSSNVKTLGRGIVSGSSNLLSIYIPSSVTTMNSSFIDCSGNLVIYCGASSAPSGWGSNWNNSRTAKYSVTESSYRSTVGI